MASPVSLRVPRRFTARSVRARPSSCTFQGTASPLPALGVAGKLCCAGRGGPRERLKEVIAGFVRRADSQGHLRRLSHASRDLVSHSAGMKYRGIDSQDICHSTRTWFETSTPDGVETFARLENTCVYVIAVPADWSNDETDTIREAMVLSRLLPHDFAPGRLVSRSHGI